MWDYENSEREVMDISVISLKVLSLRSDKRLGDCRMDIINM